ncbi:MAG TPA: hypothetical protein VJP02_12505 [Candidatus Sulfotelmatobacter sp.]|nr:hypothetical protein [Candidatus Sulfotelmatobacter sp.]
MWDATWNHVGTAARGFPAAQVYRAAAFDRKLLATTTAGKGTAFSRAAAS